MVGLGGRRRWGKGTSQIFLTFDDGLDCRKKCKKITQKIALKMFMQFVCLCQHWVSMRGNLHLYKLSLPSSTS